MKQTKRILSLLVSLAIVFTMIVLPKQEVKAWLVDNASDLNTASEILKLDETIPEQLDKYPDDVYGMGEEQPFLLSEQNELALIIQGSKGPKMYRMDTFNMNMTYRDEYDRCWINGINFANATKISSFGATNLENYNDLYFIQSIGVDRDGTGRKQFVASAGYTANYVRLVVQHAATGAAKTYTIGKAAIADTASHWMMDNYLAITAGDYDGDGRDSIVVYFCGDGDNAKLIEFYPTSGDEWASRTVLNLNTVLVNKEYQTSDEYKHRPVVSLATGDFNGNGRDQLAFSAGFYNTSGGPGAGYQDYECDNLEQFSSCIGICDYNSGWSASSPIWMYDKSSDFIGGGSEKTYAVTIMHAAVIAAGDVDNDGMDEIVAAGYLDKDKDDDSKNYARVTEVNGKVTKVSDICNWSDKLVCSVINYSNTGYGRTALKAFAMPNCQNYTFHNYCKEEDFVFTKLAMACGKVNGNNSPEEVFIGGIVYDFSKQTPKVIYTPEFVSFDETTVSGDGAGTQSSVNWVRNVAAGNFNANDAGREQFVFTFWQKVYGSDHKEYSAIVGAIAGVEYQDDKDTAGNVTSYGAPKYHACSVTTSPWWSEHPINDSTDTSAAQVFVKVASSSYAINAVPVAVDMDDDGLMGRFVKKGYVYTDPEVYAVLQAAPYFADINKAGGYEDPGDTAYGFSYSFGNSTSRSDNVSFEVGLNSEVAGPALKMSLELGYAMDWSHSYETSYKVETSTTFHAQSKSIVVLSRVPQLVYIYDLWNPDTQEWIPQGYNVRVPMTPKFFQLSIDEYNEFVDEYNARLKPNSEYALFKIQPGIDIPADHEGYPENYWSDWAQAGPYNSPLSDESFTLGYSSGNVEFSYLTEEEQSETEEVSHGFHYGFSIQGGASFVVGEAWVGGYGSIDYSHSTGYTSTTATAKNCSGKVQNISLDDLELDGMTKAQFRQAYAFDWSFGKWAKQLAQNGGAVTFYGYTLTKVAHRALPPANSEQTKIVNPGYSAFSDGTVTASLNSVLKVSKVSGNSKISYDSNTKKIKVAAGLAEGSYSAIFKISNGVTALDTTLKYTVVVTNDTLPVITTQPKSQSVSAGTPVSFKVAASGSNLSYQWYYRTSSNGTWQQSTSTCANTDTYSLPASSVTTSRSGYQYRCVVSNAAGSVTSSAATLTVTPSAAPIITTQPKSQSVSAGTPVDFKVAASGTNLKYQWYYRTSSTGTWQKSTASCATTNTYSLAASSVTTSRSGYQYRCVVSNSSGSVTSNAATLTVTASGPTITTQPKSQTVNAGTAVDFKVVASGSNLKYQWYYRTSSTGTWTKSTAACATTNTYSLAASSVTKARSGYQYRCVVSNSSGSTTSNAATLTVNASGPTITTQPKSQTVNAGTAVSFKVVASGTNLKYQWYYRTSSTGTWTKSTAACATTNTYSLAASSVTKARSGYQYRCIVSDSTGSTTSNAATLTVNASGPTITTQPKSQTVSAGTAVSFKVVASGSHLKYQWYYRTSSTGTWTKSTAACATTNTYSLAASSVTKARSGYQYRCVVTDGNGQSVTSSAATLTVQ